MAGTSTYRSLLGRYLDKEEPLKCWDVRRYRGCFFETDDNSFYYIDWSGRIHGRPSMQNAKVEMIGGIEPETYDRLYEEKGWDLLPRGHIPRQDVAEMIIGHGKKVRRGRRLAVVISPEDVALQKSPWMITSEIRNLHYVH